VQPVPNWIDQADFATIVHHNWTDRQNASIDEFLVLVQYLDLFASLRKFLILNHLIIEHATSTSSQKLRWICLILSFSFKSNTREREKERLFRFLEFRILAFVTTDFVRLRTS